LAHSIIQFFSFLPHWLEVFIISMVPIVELRGAIPVGTLLMHMPYLQTFLLAWAGSIVPAPFILKLLPALLKWMRSKKGALGRFAEWLHERGMNKSKSITKYKFSGLMIFIAIPLPGTGVWTGCLAASLIEMDFKQGVLSAVLGSAIAGVIVTALCAFGLMAAGA
jgi:uncharacterized membrane protein